MATKRELRLRVQSYENGRIRGREEGIKMERERLEQESKMRRERSEALIKVLNSASQAVSAMAGILDNAHGVL